jgi:hypothetical protein
MVNLVKPDRLFTSLIYIGSMTLVILNEMFWSKSLLRIILICVQMCALVWYCLSYIPGARRACWGCLKACCNKNGDSEESA